MEYRNQQGVVMGRDRTAVGVDEGLRTYMLKVYNWMGLGLALTGAVAFAVISVPGLKEIFFAESARRAASTRPSPFRAGSRCSRRWRWCSSSRSACTP